MSYNKLEHLSLNSIKLKKFEKDCLKIVGE